MAKADIAAESTQTEQRLRCRLITNSLVFAKLILLRTPMLWRSVGRLEQAGEHNKQMRFARKQNMNLRPIEQIRFPRKGNTLFTKNPIFENYVEFCRQNNANSQAVCHIPHKISRTQHSRQRRCRARPSVPSRRSAASRSRLRRCGGVRKRERAACFSFRFLSIIFY